MLSICLLPGVFLYWILGARLTEKPYSLMYRQQDLIIQAVLHPTRAAHPDSVRPTLPGRSSGNFPVNRGVLLRGWRQPGEPDFLMERRGHDLSHLPPKIRRYNLKLLAVLYAVVVVLLLRGMCWLMHSSNCSSESFGSSP